MPTPSISASRTPPNTADTDAVFHPPRAASIPPVSAPAAIEFHGSSFCLIPFIAQSKVENMPPHIPKLPPRTGPLVRIAVTAPLNRSP
ncbi:hypothetical protein AYI69_g36 [Smittium culicis]|uniref:Uncharacterized protein n=1 Tax=Smittium culicis TaxID=133412 RepID=A0A1R1YU54_9FUNG|nr:hypothetical protein AYI69_g36 [Smittium culicis]